METRKTLSFVFAGVFIFWLGYIANFNSKKDAIKQQKQQFIKAYIKGKENTLTTVRSIINLDQRQETGLSYLIDLQIERDTAEIIE